MRVAVDMARRFGPQPVEHRVRGAQEFPPEAQPGLEDERLGHMGGKLIAAHQALVVGRNGVACVDGHRVCLCGMGRLPDAAWA